MAVDVEGKVTLDREPVDAAVTADPSQRLIVPRERQARRPFALILAACLTAHALLLTILLFEDFSVASEPTRAEEIPVEIVAELPPEQNSLPPPPDLVTPPVVKEKPPPEKVQLDDANVAFDAPKTGNDSKTHKGAPDKETKAPRVAPPPKLAAPQPAQEKPEQEKAATASKEKAANPSPPAEPQKLADDTPDAEALDKAQPEPPAKSKDKQNPKPGKSPPVEGKNITVAQQLAALAPAPNYSFGAAAKAAPIGGGTEKPSYLAYLAGLIMPRFNVPASARARHLDGTVRFYIDEMGNLTHQALVRSSGQPDLDSAAVAAVRRSAPFPAPPLNVRRDGGMPLGINWNFSSDGR
jgi:protein TonB